MQAVKERLRSEAAKAAQVAQQAAEKVASSENVAKLKEKAAAAAKAAEEKASAAGLTNHLQLAREQARSSFSNLSSLLQRESENEASSDDNHNEEVGLVQREASTDVSGRVRAVSGLGASALQDWAASAGCKLGQLGAAGKARLDASVESAKSAGALAREASAAKLEAARQASANVASKGADGMRTAAAAGSSGMSKLASATAEAKGRAGEALSAAAMVSGVSVPGQKKEAQCCDLTYRQRLTGCIACMLIGTLLSLMSLGSLAQLVLGNPLPFAFKYTVGNLLSLGAASFLVGPRAQLRGMLAPQRRAASLIYVATLVGTLLTVLVIRRALLALVFIVLQFLALTWYMLSYIPYGQAAAKRIARRLLRRGGLLAGEETERQQHRASAVSPASEG